MVEQSPTTNASHKRCPSRVRIETLSRQEFHAASCGPGAIVSVTSTMRARDRSQDQLPEDSGFEENGNRVLFFFGRSEARSRLVRRS